MNFKDRKFYGTTTLGKKGQTVVPMEARRALKLKEGDKLLVFSFGNMLAFAKPAGMEKLAIKLAKRLEAINKIIAKTSKNPTRS